MWLAPGEVRVQPHLLKQHPQSCFHAPRLLTGVTRRLVGPDVPGEKLLGFGLGEWWRCGRTSLFLHFRIMLLDCKWLLREAERAKF